MKIRQVEAMLFHADRRSEMTKLIVALITFATAPNKTVLRTTASASVAFARVHATSVCVLTPSSRKHFGSHKNLIIHYGMSLIFVVLVQPILTNFVTAFVRNSVIILYNKQSG